VTHRLSVKTACETPAFFPDGSRILIPTRQTVVAQGGLGWTLETSTGVRAGVEVASGGEAMVLSLTAFLTFGRSGR